MSAVLMKKWDKKSEKYKNWWDKYKTTCYINYSGSSDSMEKLGAIEMFLHAIDKNGLRYTTFVGDGDSNCYASVCEALKNALICYSYEVKKRKTLLMKKMLHILLSHSLNIFRHL